MYNDRHHLIYDRVSWTSRPEARQLRENKGLIVSIPRIEHEQNHRQTTAVPLLGYYALRRTLNIFERGDTAIETVENLMTAIETTSRHPKAHEIERDLSQLAIRAIELQRDFLLDIGYAD